MDVGRALARIGYSGPATPTLPVLAALQRAFLLAVPFENLDIHLGREISLDPDAVYAKIVGRRRGGFCYECNGLFHDLLVEIGFPVTMHSARMVEGERVGAEFDHMVLRVDMGAGYLVDVGNGRSCRTPLPLDGSEESMAEGLAYRVGEHAASPALLVRGPAEPWRPRFLFGLTPRRRQEFAGMCRFHQSSPESTFTQGRVVTLATEGGRTTLTGMRLQSTENGRSEVRVLSSDEEYRRILGERFGIVLDSGRDRWKRETAS